MPWVVGVVVGVGLVGAPSAVAFQGPWAPVVDLSASAEPGPAQQVAVAADGTTTVIWRHFTGLHNILQASTRPPGGTFGPPVDLSTPGRNAYLPRVAVAPDGTTTAVWYRNNPPDRNFVVQASTRPPGGTFGPPVDLSATDHDAYSPQVAVAPDGTTTAVWYGRNGADITFVVQASTRPPGGTFGPPVDLSASDQNAFGPQVAAAPDGTTTSIWSRNGPVQASTRPPGGTFGPPVDLSASDPGQNATLPQVTIAPNGTTTAVWRRSDPSYTNQIVQASTRPPGGTFGPPVDLSAPSKDVGGPQVAVARDGTATAIWYRSNGKNVVVQYSARPPGRRFGAPINLSALGQNALDPQVAVAPDGTTTAIWFRTWPTEYPSAPSAMDTVVQASTRLPGGRFGSPITLSAPGLNYSVVGRATAPQVAVAPDGTATAVWNRADDRTTTMVQAAFTASPPTPRRTPRVTGTPRIGRTLRCRPATFTGAASITTTWLRGTTPIATGPSYQVTTRDRGAALTCRTRGSNPYGTTDSRSTALRIPPGPPIPPGPAKKAPVARSLPTVTGTPRIGHALRCRPGTFTGATSTSTSWLRGSRIIPGARKTTHTLTRADSGKTIACRTTANGPGGTSTTISLRTHARP